MQLTPSLGNLDVKEAYEYKQRLLLLLDGISISR
jgi:hypothetical protein